MWGQVLEIDKIIGTRGGEVSNICEGQKRMKAKRRTWSDHATLTTSTVRLHFRPLWLLRFSSPLKWSFWVVQIFYTLLKENFWFHTESGTWKQIELKFHGSVEKHPPSICIWVHKCRNLPPSVMKVSITNGSRRIRSNLKAICKEIGNPQAKTLIYLLKFSTKYKWDKNVKLHNCKSQKTLLRH